MIHRSKFYSVTFVTSGNDFDNIFEKLIPEVNIYWFKNLFKFWEKIGVLNSIVADNRVAILQAVTFTKPLFWNSMR